MIIYTAGITAQANGTVSLLANTLKGLLINSTSTIPTQNEETISTLADFTTLGELSGTGYARASVTGLTITKDTVNKRAVWTWTPVLFSALNPNNGTVKGFLLFDDSTQIPILFDSFTISANGTAIKVSPNTTNGAVYFKQKTV